MKFNNPFAASDSVILKVIDSKLKVYLLQLAQGPFAGKMALPGSSIRENETLDDAVERVFFEATAQKPLYIEQLYTFSGLDRDPRSRSICTAYITVPKFTDKFDLNLQKYSAGDWFEIDQVPALAYDHNEIIQKAISRLSSKINYSTLALFLMPEKFTLSELQNLYESLLKKSIDKRNFRKKILSLKIVKETGEIQTGEKARPAKLYCRASNKLIYTNIFV